MTNFILLAAFVIAIRAGRSIDAAIIGILLLLGLFFLAAVAVAWKRGLTDETSETGTHQRLILDLDGSTQTLLVTNNVSIGKRVPAAVGDHLLVHGEYVWNEQGGLVHFTHHDPQGSHEGGWIDRLGVRYQ